MIQFKTDYKDALVFSHDDFDGIMSAYAVKDEFDNNLVNSAWDRNVTCYLCDYSAKYDFAWFKNAVQNYASQVGEQKFDVYMLDYAIQPNEDMIKFKNYLESCNIEFIWCDHHITAIEKLLHYNFKGFQNTKFAGCVNTWNFLHGNFDGSKDDELPMFYRLANEFDLWHKDSTLFDWEKIVIPLSFYMKSLGTELNDNTGELVSTIKQCLERPEIIEQIAKGLGKPIYDYEMTCAQNNSAKIYESQFNGYSCLVINSLGSNTYEFQYHPKFKEVDLLVRWDFDGTRYNYGLYTLKDDIDVGELCTKYLLGGGHRKAGGGSSLKLMV